MLNNKKILIALSTLAITFGMTASSANASPIGTTNVRPVAVNDPSPAAGEASVSQIVECIFSAGCTDPSTKMDNPAYAVSGQSSVGQFSVATSPSTIIPTLAFEYTAASDSLGIWSGTDSSAVSMVKLFNANSTGVNDGGATSAGLQFNSNGSVTVFGNDCSKVNCGTFTGINPFSFGFYLNNGSQSFFTEDSLNPNGGAQALTYTDGMTNWAVAFEDIRLNNGSDKDYNDAVLKVESVTGAAPEPGTLLMLGAGLLAVAGVGRRRLNRR